MAFKYKYTTGPISVSEYIDNIRAVVLNNGSSNHTVVIKIFNLDTKPKEQVYSESFNVAVKSIAGTEYIPSFDYFEVQIFTDSRHVYAWVGGRAGNENLPGNTVLQKNLISF
jgi:hypothetical protein